MSDEYASSGYKGSLVSPCTSYSPIIPSSALIPSLATSSHQRHNAPPRTRDHCTILRLRNEELPPSRRQYVPRPSLFNDAPTHAHYSLLLATSSGGRRTGPPDSAGPAIQSQPQALQGPEPPRGREQHRDAESLDTRKEAADALAARYRASRERLGGVGA